MTSETWTHDTLTTNGVTLHYVTQGQGDLMLMLHGFPEFWYSWRHQIPEFAQHYKVVALDLRGYNDSDKPESVDAYRMEELVKDVNGAIHALGYDRCILVGHDWGGAIAWSFAYAHPDRVDRLIVMNLPHPAKFVAGLKTPQQLLRSWYIFFFQLPILPELVLWWDDYRMVAAAFADMAINKSAFTPEDLDAFKTAAAKRGALTAMLNYYRANFGRDNRLNRPWDKLLIPTLLIWGEKDAALGVELTYGTEDYVEDLKICYIPNCSHWVQQEQPQLVNQYMRDFLDRDDLSVE
ncbi:MAG: alpha/beta hydrolase [Synechococcales cyanobacterium T60_A2020_003]|nr:alpha/beta hydrolase [Synechococcales cyanobacterium T60_A2020_003]